jgi:hypothetical protein
VIFAFILRLGHFAFGGSLDLEPSIVAAQNALIVTPTTVQPERQAAERQQQAQKQDTELPRTQVVLRQNSAEGFEQAEKYRQRRQNFNDSLPDRSSQNAINLYQSFAIDEQRKELQMLVGVDTYV